MRTNSECVRNILTGGKNQVLGVTIEISDDLTASLDEMEPHEAVGMAAESADRWNSLHIHRSLLISVTSEEPNIPRPGFLPSYMENHLSKVAVTVRKLTGLSLSETRSSAFLLRPNYTNIFSGLKTLDVQLDQIHGAPLADILPDLSVVGLFYSLGWSFLNTTSVHHSCWSKAFPILPFPVFLYSGWQDENLTTCRHASSSIPTNTMLSSLKQPCSQYATCSTMLRIPLQVSEDL